MRCNVVCKMLIYYLRAEVVIVKFFSPEAKILGVFNMTNLGNFALFGTLP